MYIASTPSLASLARIKSATRKACLPKKRAPSRLALEESGAIESFGIAGRRSSAVGDGASEPSCESDSSPCLQRTTSTSDQQSARQTVCVHTRIRTWRQSHLTFEIAETSCSENVWICTEPRASGNVTLLADLRRPLRPPGTSRSPSARESLMIPDMGLLPGRMSPRLDGRLSKPPSPRTC